MKTFSVPTHRPTGPLRAAAMELQFARAMYEVARNAHAGSGGDNRSEFDGDRHQVVGIESGPRPVVRRSGPVATRKLARRRS